MYGDWQKEKRKKKKERYTHTRPDKYREILWYSGCGTLSCPDRGQLTKSVKWWIDERFNLSRGANPCYRDISIIGGEGDIRGWPVFQTDNRRYDSRGWSIIKGLGCPRSMPTTRIAWNCVYEIRRADGTGVKKGGRGCPPSFRFERSEESRRGNEGRWKKEKSDHDCAKHCA